MIPYLVSANADKKRNMCSAFSSMIMKKKIVYILFLFYSLQSCSQDIGGVVEAISSLNILQCEFVGLSGEEGDQFKKYKLLKSLASKYDLLSLLDHDSLAVVGYASKALIEKDLIEPEWLVSKFINSNVNVTIHCGCSIWSEPIGHYIYGESKRFNSEISKGFDSIEVNFKDSNKQIKVDSLILFNYEDDLSNFPYPIFHETLYPVSYNKRIEFLAFERNNYDAMEYLISNYGQAYIDRSFLMLSEIKKSSNLQDRELDRVNFLIKKIKEHR